MVRKRYSCSYSLGGGGRGPIDIGLVAIECLNWLRNSRYVDSAKAEGLHYDSPSHNIDLGENAWVDIRHFISEEGVRWGLQFSHHDTETPDMIWVTRLCLSQKSEADGVEFACENGVSSIGHAVMPTRRDFSRPVIVERILQKWPAHSNGVSLSNSATTLTSDEVTGFVDLLNDASRVRPVVLVSATNDTDEPLIDANKLASWLAGVAFVFVAANRFPSRRLSEAVGERFSCWDGAIRLYWPLITYSDPYRHKLWTSERVRYFEQNRRHGIHEVILGKIAEAAVYVSDPAAPSWAYLDHLNRQLLLEKARDEGSFEEMIEIYQDEIESLTDQAADSSSIIRDLEDQLSTSRAKELSWREAYYGIAIEQGKESGEELLVETVADAICIAEDRYGDRLVFALNSKSEGERSPYQRPEEVLSAFEFLANTYRDARMGVKPCADLDLALREEVGWRYKYNQSEATMGKYRDWYVTDHGNREHVLEEHLRKGSSKDARYTISIAIAWDSDSEKVIIGFLGQHQKTDAT